MKKYKYNAKQRRLLELGKIPEKNNFISRYKKIREKQVRIFGLTVIETFILYIMGNLIIDLYPYLHNYQI